MRSGARGRQNKKANPTSCDKICSRFPVGSATLRLLIIRGSRRPQGDGYRRRTSLERETRESIGNDVYFPHICLALRVEIKATRWKLDLQWTRLRTPSYAGCMARCMTSVTSSRARTFPDLLTRGSQPLM